MRKHVPIASAIVYDPIVCSPVGFSGRRLLRLQRLGEESLQPLADARIDANRVKVSVDGAVLRLTQGQTTSDQIMLTMARRGKAWQGVARRGKAWQLEVRQRGQTIRGQVMCGQGVWSHEMRGQAM